MSDLDATVAWAASHQLRGTSTIWELQAFAGVVIVWLYTAHNPKVKAGVAWYGRLVGESTP